MLPKKQILDQAKEIFAKGKSSDDDPGVKEFAAKIGRLAMENDLLSVARSVASGIRAQKSA
jgi:hypothetical protein